MTLSKEEMHNEFAYNMTMAQVKNLLKMGLITTDEYWQINQKYKRMMSPALLLCHQPRDNDKMFILWSLRAPFHIPLLVGRSMIYWKH